jgi:uncharacterized membrane protein YdjX (TVP38/TMEM64 family)
LLSAGAVALLVFLIVLAQRAPAERTIAWIEGLGGWGPAVLAALYVPLTVVCFPSLVLNIGAGALFGIPIGILTSVVGSTFGALAAFVTSRELVRHGLGTRWRDDRRVRALDATLERDGFRMVVLSRLALGIPFNLLNYAYGLTRVAVRDFALGSLVGMLPFRVVYVYLGSLLGTAAGTKHLSSGEVVLDWSLLGIGVAATLLLTRLVARIAKQAMEAHQRET